MRKEKVIAALYWLMGHNALYQEYCINIDTSNLEWMGDMDE
jgi:hypothetical protein